MTKLFPKYALAVSMFAAPVISAQAANYMDPMVLAKILNPEQFPVPTGGTPLAAIEAFRNSNEKAFAQYDHFKDASGNLMGTREVQLRIVLDAKLENDLWDNSLERTKFSKRYQKMHAEAKITYLSILLHSFMGITNAERAIEERLGFITLIQRLFGASDQVETLTLLVAEIQTNLQKLQDYGFVTAENAALFEDLQKNYETGMAIVLKNQMLTK